MEMEQVGFIGCGNIADAIIGGMVGSGYIKSEKILAYDLDGAKAFRLSATYGVAAAKSAADVVNNCKYVFLTIKPQVYEAVLDEISGFVTSAHCLVDVAAGVTTDYVKKQIGWDCKVIRVMPNTPLLTGNGASALVKLPPVSDEEFRFVRGAFDASGVTVEVEESMIDSVIAVSGSAPAFVFRFAKNVIESGVAAGLPEEAATRLMAQTLIGSAHMILESGMSLDELIKMVSSPGGTTVAGLSAMEAAGFDKAVREGADASIARSIEMRR